MDVKLPHLGEGADSGTVVNLFVKEGDQIAKDQPLIELENEKAIATIPSTAAGKVTKIFVKTGDKISVGQPILSLAEAVAAAAKAEPQVAAPAKEQAGEPESAEASEESKEQPEIEPRPPGVEPAAAPSIRKLARELGIDLSRVRGSERGGRIVLADVRAYIQRLQKMAAHGRIVDSAAQGGVPCCIASISGVWLRRGVDRTA